jgi:MYXO-CTERM domain-containing protein
MVSSHRRVGALAVTAIMAAIVSGPVADRAAASGRQAFSVSNVRVQESLGTAAVTVTRTTRTGSASVHFSTADASATSPADYSSVSRTVTFAAGVRSVTVYVAIIDDGLDEDDEAVRLQLSAPSAGYELDDRGAATLRIVDNDAPPTVAVADTASREGENLAFEVTLSAPSGRTLRVGWTTSAGSATFGADFVAAKGTLEFGPGVTSRTITIATIQDTEREGDETMAVSLRRPENVVITDGSATGIIRDDDISPDSDGDGLSDADEVLHGTDPHVSDTDNDGLTDGAEVNTYATDPNDTDTDNDGLTDGNEVNTHGTNPNKADTDNDGLDDGDEITNGTDPHVSDTDNDGLSDGDEVNTYGTDPNDTDTDGDGLDDGAEVGTYGTDPNDTDSDDDTLTDGDEVNTYGTDPTDADSDDDTLTDGDEVHTYGTSPIDADTDDGGVGDGVEVGRGTDPLDPSDDMPTDTGDTGDTGGETGVIDTSNPDSGVGYQDWKGGGGCACSSAEAPTSSSILGVFGALLGLAGLRRRR